MPEQGLRGIGGGRQHKRQKRNPHLTRLLEERNTKGIGTFGKETWGGEGAWGQREGEGGGT